MYVHLWLIIRYDYSVNIYPLDFPFSTGGRLPLVVERCPWATSGTSDGYTQMQHLFVNCLLLSPSGLFVYV